MKKTLLIWGALPMAAWAHGDHDFHDALTQAVHGLGHADVLAAIVVLGILGVCVGRYLAKRK